MNSNLTTMWNAMQSGMGNHIPALLGALAVLVLGWLLAVLARAGVRRGLGKLNLNTRFAQLTGQSINLENGLAIAIFWIVMLF
ncbi:MAG TPA: hypothetical protein PLV15_11400, partial [Smithella sp.]|nr:hypothetical protein [Smithella sp.]